MNNTEKYDMLSEGQTGVPSNMGILGIDPSLQLNSDYISRQLSSNKEFALNEFKVEEENSFSANIQYKDEEFEVLFFVAPTTNLKLEEYGFANQITESDLNTAKQQPFLLEVSLFFGEKPLESFHLQLKIMNAIMPDASLVIDFISYRLLSAQWLRMTANSQIPPSPDYLYTIHGVYDEKGNKKYYWFHTHGLIRCGTVELEILNVSDGPQQMNDVIQMVVKKFLKDPAKENEKFQIGYDGMGLHMAWIRWEEALKDMPSDILGGMDERQDEDNVHAEPSGILFAVEDNNLVSPQIYAKTLADNPIFYISDEETSRMSALAKERFACFKDAFEKHAAKPEKVSFFKKMLGKKEQEQPQWRFLVKLGLTVDNSESETDREHLWFDVLSIDGKTIEGELLNQPYWISSLKQGDVNKYPVDLLTDWLIYGPENDYTTDSIYQLGYYK